MGNGIAHVCALGRLRRGLLTTSPRGGSRRGLQTIGKNMERQVSAAPDHRGGEAAALARISYRHRLESVRRLRPRHRGGDRERGVKREIFKALCPQAEARGADLATNTSSISITRLASVTDRPGKFIGMHFMNPVPVMQLVELIRGIATDEPTFEVREGLRREARQDHGGVAEDFPAFIVNRILLPMINEAVYTLYEGVGSSRRSTRR
jgi:3-hydroxybutyryl-CoA dehydrogenase